MTPERINWINETLARRDGWIQESSGEWVLYNEHDRREHMPLQWQRACPTYHRLEDAGNLLRVMCTLAGEQRKAVVDAVAQKWLEDDCCEDAIEHGLLHCWLNQQPELVMIVAGVVKEEEAPGD